ncbi:hypothetical protein MMC27_001804 [Xylographa pallens]|nr:hypothetical protein [Xylographa pallens]
MRCYTRIFLTLIHLLYTFRLATSMTNGIPAAPLLSKFRYAMGVAERHMQGADQTMPFAFENGGGCFTGFGRVSLQECVDALAQMPSHNLSPDDITEGPHGQVLTLDFKRREPKIWKTGGACVIGLSLYDKPSAKGLYPHFQEAASLIVNTCAARGIGGLIRFSHFEVVVFDEGMLPRPVPNHIFDFSQYSSNIPFSRGLRRLWERRSRQAASVTKRNN